MQTCRVSSTARPCIARAPIRSSRLHAVRARAPIRSSRLHVVALQAGAADHTARVRGDHQRVSWYCSDLSFWPAWSPLTKQATKLGLSSDPVKPGSKFELKQDLWGVLNYPMLYEVLEFEPGKKLVLSGLSEHHTQVDRFIFMPDRHDANMTIVRYMSNAQLRQWRSALQPVVSKILSRVPGDSLDSLQRLLNGPRSPIYSYEFQEAWQRHTRAAVDARKGRKSTASGAAATGGRSGTRRQRVGGFSWGGGVQGWSFDGLWGGARGSGDAGGMWPDPVYHALTTPQDPAGHYAALGIILSPGAPPTNEEIRTAYRRMALELHPDRQIGKNTQVKSKAAVDFTRVLKAYEVLKDPELRRLYDSGQLMEQTVEL